MRFGVREICDVVFRAKSKMTLGNRTFYKNEPVLYFDTLRTSTLEGASTTVYAQGGRGYARLIAWEGERTITFTMEDALLSPESFAILSGAGLMDATSGNPIYVHTTSQIQLEADNTIILPDLVCWNKDIAGIETTDHRNSAADIFVMVLDNNGEVDAEPCVPVSVTHNAPAAGQSIITCYSHTGTLPADTVVLVDYYVLRTSGAQEITITAESFSGNFYIEASTLFRRQSDGVDMPAEFIIPNGKVQSNFTFTMAANGDPSTFTFTVDAFPDYTKFDRTQRVFATIQVIDDESGEDDETREPCENGVDQTTRTFNVSVINDSASTITEAMLNTDNDVTTQAVAGTISGVSGGDTIDLTLDTAAVVDVDYATVDPGTSATEHTVTIDSGEDVDFARITISDE